MKVRYTRPAAADVVALLEFLAEQSPQGARRVRDRLRDIERLLVQFPLSGQVTRLGWLRRIVMRPYPYLLFYEATEAEVIIHSVWHGARDPSDLPG